MFIDFGSKTHLHLHSIFQQYWGPAETCGRTDEHFVCIVQVPHFVLPHSFQDNVFWIGWVERVHEALASPWAWIHVYGRDCVEWHLHLHNQRGQPKNKPPGGDDLMHPFLLTYLNIGDDLSLHIGITWDYHIARHKEIATYDAPLCSLQFRSGKQRVSETPRERGQWDETRWWILSLGCSRNCSYLMGKTWKNHSFW